MKKTGKKSISIVLILTMVLAVFIPTFVKAEDKDVWIDNTIDNSTTKVTAVLKVKNLKTGEETESTIYDQTGTAQFSEPKPATIVAMISEAKSALTTKAGEYVDNFDPETIVESETTGKVWDNRKYETIEDSDAVLIGDTDYINGYYDSSNMTRTHVASGDYGKETFYTLEGYVEISGEAEGEGEVSNPTYNFLKGANSTYTIDADDKGTFEIDADYSLFGEGGKVFVDDNEVDKNNYESKAGSTIIEFSKEYMSSLSEGDHTLKIAFNNGGSATTQFSIAKVNTPVDETTTTEGDTETTETTADTINNPKTGDSIAIWIGLMLISILGIAITEKSIKKD